MIRISCGKTEDENFAREWDKFVLNYPKSTFYHLYGWKNVLANTFGFKPYYLMHATSNGEVDGVLPLFLMQDILGSRYLISNPFSNFTGLCAENQKASDELIRFARDLARKLSVQYVELRQLRQKVENSLPTRDSFATLYLKLPPSGEEAWRSISTKKRTKIRKAEKNGLKAHKGKHLLKDFYEVYAKNITFLGTPIFPIRFFENLLKEFPGRTDVIVLRHGKRPVAGMFLFEFGEIIAEPWASSLREYGRYYANYYLYWKAIEYAANNGFEIFDFGRSTVGTGPYNFKIEWGAEPIPLFYQYIFVKSTEMPKVDAKENKYEIAVNLWKKMPYRLAYYLGPLFVKYLPEL